MDAIQALVEILANVKLGEASCWEVGCPPSSGRSRSQTSNSACCWVYGCHPSSGGNPHKRQSLQAAGQFDALQALVEVAAQRQTPQAAE